MIVRRRDSKQSLLRLLDANANRALEGARVCEEISRFHLESARAFHRLRRLRHGIGHAVADMALSPADRARARDSRADVGRRSPASRVASLEQSLLINFQRVKESLRALEEGLRLIHPQESSSFQRLRFRTYEVERDLLLEVEALRHHRPRRRKRP